MKRGNKKKGRQMRKRERKRERKHFKYCSNSEVSPIKGIKTMRLSMDKKLNESDHPKENASKAVII